MRLISSWSRRACSCSLFTVVKTTWWVPDAGLVAQLTAASASAQAAAVASMRRMTTPIGRVRLQAAGSRARPRTRLPAAQRRGPGCRALTTQRSSAARRPRHPPGAPKERGCKVDAPAARLLGARGRVLPAELVHAARGVDDLLLARIERMAVRAHLDLQILTEGRARLERIAARAGDGDLSVVGVDCGFHGGLTLSQKAHPDMGSRGRRLKGARV